MADDITLNAGTGGDTVAADDIGGIKVPRVKLVLGANNTNDGDVASGNPLPVTGTLTAVTTITNVVHVDDNSSTVSVDDGAGSLTVDGSVTANAGTNLNTSALALESGGNLATVAALSRAEDAAHASGHTGVMALAVREAVATDLSAGATDGDYEPLQVSASGRLWVSATVDAALPAGTNAIGKLAANSGVDIGDVDVTSLPNVTLAAGTNTNEVVGDVAHDAVIAGNPVTVGAVASAAAPTDVSADQDAVRIWALRSGAVAVQPTMAGVLAVAGNGASGTGVPRVTIANDSTGILATVSTVTTVSTLTGGGVAHDGADSGNPIKVGFKAETSPKGITLVADGDRTDAYADADGMLMVKLNTSGADIVSEAVSDTGGSSTAFSNFSAVASTRNYITAISVFRVDAGATPAFVDFRDGTAGSVLWRAVLPPNGGSVIVSPTPLFKTTANTALAYDVSAALTTVYISVSGYQSKV